MSSRVSSSLAERVNGETFVTRSYRGDENFRLVFSTIEKDTFVKFNLDLDKNLDHVKRKKQQVE